MDGMDPEAARPKLITKWAWSTMPKWPNIETWRMGRVGIQQPDSGPNPRLPSSSVSNELMKGIGFDLTKPSSAGSAKTRAPNAEIRDSIEKEEVEYH